MTSFRRCLLPIVVSSFVENFEIFELDLGAEKVYAVQSI